MFPGLHNQPHYVLSQVKKKCFDENGNITPKSEKTPGVHPLVFRIAPPHEQPKNRKKILVERTKQLIDSMEQFKKVSHWLVETQDSDDLNSLSDGELKMQMKEALSFLGNAQEMIDRLDRDAAMDVLYFLNKATTAIKQYDDES